MTNAKRFIPLLLIVVSSLGALSVWQPREQQIPDPESVPVAAVVYAAPAEQVETHVLASGETLSGVLARAAITGRELSGLLLALTQHENPRRLTAGAEVTVRRWIYNGAPRAVEVRLNADSTLRLARHEIGWDGELLITPTQTDTVYASGSIEAGRTLYEALVYDESSRVPASERVSLVTSLAEVYQYKIDFTREIQPGDTYRLVYEREARPDGTARAVKIIASELTNQGTLYPAYWFEAGDDRGHFDAEGRSLRDGFLRYPVAYRITSTFSLRRYHPVLGIYRAHSGTDFGAPAGTPVKATANGTVTFAGVNGGYGNVIDVRHSGGYVTRYAHLSRFAAGVRVGTKVSQEDVIGYVGATGLATGPHLHYELRLNGRPLDVRTAELPKGVPIEARYMAEFRQIVTDRLALLERATDGAPRLARRGPAPVRRNADGI